MLESWLFLITRGLRKCWWYARAGIKSVPVWASGLDLRVGTLVLSSFCALSLGTKFWVFPLSPQFGCSDQVLSFESLSWVLSSVLGFGSSVYEVYLYWEWGIVCMSEGCIGVLCESEHLRQCTWTMRQMERKNFLRGKATT